MRVDDLQSRRSAAPAARRDLSSSASWKKTTQAKNREPMGGAVVCWDFDETLGYFRPREYAWDGLTIPQGMPPARLKPGISELLESLSEFTHVVTTAAVRDYAISVLKEFGLL